MSTIRPGRGNSRRSTAVVTPWYVVPARAAKTTSAATLTAPRRTSDDVTAFVLSPKLSPLRPRREHRAQHDIRQDLVAACGVMTAVVDVDGGGLRVERVRGIDDSQPVRRGRQRT